MKSYSERPTSRNPQARRAWDHLQALHPEFPIEHMFFSRDHLEGPRWVSYHGSHGAFGHWTGDGTSMVIGGGGIFGEVTAAELREEVGDGVGDTAV